MNFALGLFWGTNDYIWFPFLTWITYPILGYFFGKLLIRCKDKDKFYKGILLVTVPLSIALWIYSYKNNVRFGAFGELYQYDYYNHDLMGNIVIGSFALLWLSICFYVVKYIPEYVYNVFARWSKNVNMMYCLHYAIIGWLVLVIETESQTPGKVMLLALCIFVVTDLICVLLNNKKRKAFITT